MCHRPRRSDAMRTLDGELWDSLLAANLPEDLLGVVHNAATEGERHTAHGHYREAISAYKRGLSALPRPRSQWTASLWFKTAIGDAQWFDRDYAAASRTWVSAIIAGALGNPFVHMRLGQTLLELGREHGARNELLRALMIGGVRVFQEEDPRYFQFIASRALPPPGCESWTGFAGLPDDHPALRYLLDRKRYSS